MGDVRLDHIEAGSGPALLLLHAFPFPATMWQPQLDGLSDVARVVAPELAPDRHAGLDAIADAVAALVAELNLAPVVVGGLSMGGYVAFAFLRRHRSLVKGLILADTRAGADTQEVLDRRTSQQATVAEEGTRPIVEAMLKGLPGQFTQDNRPDVMAEIERLMSQVSPEHVTAALEAMKQRPDSTPDLAGIDVPTLVIVGEQDSLSPPDVAEEMCRALPDAQLAVIPNAGHLSNLEDRDEFNRVVRAFLQRVERLP
jgi:3-oxoadipate enol-lactonase